MVTNAHFRHVDVEGKSNKKSKKGGAKGSVATLKESIQLGCVSQDSHTADTFNRAIKLVSRILLQPENSTRFGQMETTDGEQFLLCAENLLDLSMLSQSPSFGSYS